MSENNVEEEALRFMIEKDLRTKMDTVFEQQGVNIKVGLNRLISFLVTRPADLHGLILGQVPGSLESELIRREMGRIVADGTKMVSLTPEGAAEMARAAINRLEKMAKQLRDEATSKVKRQG